MEVQKPELPEEEVERDKNILEQNSNLYYNLLFLIIMIFNLMKIIIIDVRTGNQYQPALAKNKFS